MKKMLQLIGFIALVLSALPILTRAQATPQEFTTTSAGDLATLLSTTSESLEHIVVKGNINDADLRAIDGREAIKIADLSGTTLMDGKGVATGNFPAYIYYGNKHLEEFHLPGNTTAIGTSSFFKVSALKRVVLPNGLETIGKNSFMSCYVLEEINIPESLTAIGEQAFYKTAIKELNTGASLVTIGKNAFWGSKLERIVINDALQTISNGAFGSCAQLKSFEIAAGNKHFSLIEGVLHNKAGNILIAYPIANSSTTYTTAQSVDSIGYSVFEGSRNLREITISEGVRTIPNSFCSAAVNLEKISLPSTIELLDVGAFDNCKKLSSFHIKATTPPQVVTGAFGVMFQNYTMHLYVPKGALDAYKSDEAWAKAFLSISEEPEAGVPQTNDAPHHLVYGFFQSNKQFQGQYGFGHFYLDQPSDTKLDYPLTDGESIFAGTAVDGIIYACSYFSTQEGPRPGRFLAYNTARKEIHTIGTWAEANDKSARVLDMTYDNLSKTLYALRQVGNQIKLMQVDIATGAMTELCKVNGLGGPIAADRRGDIYIVSANGQLGKLNKQTGDVEPLIDAKRGGLLGMQSLEFDQSDGKLYWVARTNGGTPGEAELVVFDISDPTNPTLKHLGKVGEGVAMQALFIPFAFGGETAPAAVKNLKASADSQGGYKVSLSWENPSTTFQDTPLEQLSSVRIYRNNQQIEVLEEVTAGATMQFSDETLSSSGLHRYTVVAFDGLRAGVRTSVLVRAGWDVPDKVTDLVVRTSNQCQEVELSWNPPAKGANDGPFSLEGVTYDIYRSGTAEPIAHSLSTLSFVDKQIPTLGRYIYRVEAKNDAGKSSLETSPLVAGPALPLPLKESFETMEQTLQKWTFADGNQDGWSWDLDGEKASRIFGFAYEGPAYIINPTLTPEDIYDDANEWIISPPLKLQKGKLYQLRFKTRALTPESLSITQGSLNRPDHQVKVATLDIPPTEANSQGEKHPKEYKVSFTADAEIACIGIKVTSPIPLERNSCIQFTELAIEDPTISSAEPVTPTLSVIKHPDYLQIEGSFRMAKLLSMRGELLLTTQAYHIDLNSLATGSYLLVVETDNGNKTFKIIL